jgi:hypothetical protein
VEIPDLLNAARLIYIYVMKVFYLVALPLISTIHNCSHLQTSSSVYRENSVYIATKIFHSWRFFLLYGQKTIPEIFVLVVIFLTQYAYEIRIRFKLKLEGQIRVMFWRRFNLTHRLFSDSVKYCENLITSHQIRLFLSTALLYELT